MPYFGVPIRNGVPIGLGSIAGFGISPFDPSQLFAGGEQGGWYDPSDLTTLFQDAAGTTAAALEQPVGLVLDKSKGLVLGAELVTNGDFSNGTTGWSTFSASGTATLSVTSGVATLTCPTGSSYATAYQAITTVVGRTYKVTGTNISGTSTAFNALRKSDTDNAATNTVTIYGGNGVLALGNASGVFVATATTSYILAQTNGAGSSITLDNISVRELPGNHLSQSTSTARPVLSARVNQLTHTEAFDNAAWSKNNISPFGSGSVVDATTSPIGTNTADLIRENNTSGEHYVSQQATKPGASIQYTLVCSVKRATAGTRNFGLGITDGTTGGYAAVFNPDTGAVVLASQGIGTTTGWSIATPSPGVNQGNGWWQFSITVTTNTSTRVDGVLYLFDGTTRTYIGDNTSNMYIWGADLRVSNDGVGLPAYQRVGAATYGVTNPSVVGGTADYDTTGFPYYLKFDGTDDFLVSSTIDPGSVDKAQVFAGVRKLSDAAAGCLTEFSANSNTNTGTFAMFAPSAAAANYFWRSYGNGSVGDVTVTTYAAPITNVLTGQGAIATDLSTLRVNGAQAGSSSADQGAGNFGSYPLYIGRRGGTSLPSNMSLYSLIVRFSATNMDAATISSTETWVNQKTLAY